jgi:chloramphenicol 3-O-phosphotransferase
MDTPDSPESDRSKRLRIAVVGPCSAGKSTLAKALKSLGYDDIRQPAQEHSYVPDMWLRISQPDILIYLDVDNVNVKKRREYVDDQQRLPGQQQRLAHARQWCDFYLDTSSLSPAEVREAVVTFLHNRTNQVRSSK